MKKTKNEKGIQESLDFIVENMVMNKDFDRLEKKVDNLEAKVSAVDNKLSNFEKTEVDKRKQLEVRVTKLEQKVS